MSRRMAHFGTKRRCKDTKKNPIHKKNFATAGKHPAFQLFQFQFEN